jgi:hypothetical protein
VTDGDGATVDSLDAAIDEAGSDPDGGAAVHAEVVKVMAIASPDVVRRMAIGAASCHFVAGQHRARQASGESRAYA